MTIKASIMHFSLGFQLPRKMRDKISDFYTSSSTAQRFNTRLMLCADSHLAYLAFRRIE